MHAKFLLLLGVSGVGKTTIIKELLEIDDRFVYISPYITRPLRQGETDKIPTTEAELQRKLASGEILAVNDIFGIRYGTPKQPIKDAFRQGKFPLLDWPIKRLEVMENEFCGFLHRVYLQPPSVAELRRRLGQDERDTDGRRLTAALQELEYLQGGHLEGKYDIRVMSEGDPKAVAHQIYQSYLYAVAL